MLNTNILINILLFIANYSLVSRSIQTKSVMLPIIPFYGLLCTINKFIVFITKDNVISSYFVNIFVNVIYISTVIIKNFEPSYQEANLIMSLLIAFYIFDTQKVLIEDFTITDKLTYIPHHLVTIALIMGQLYNMYPLKIGMWYLTMFEFSNFFLQFFHLFHKKQWITSRNIITYPFVLTYVPIRGVIIPLYSIKFIPYLSLLPITYKITFFSLFSFVNIFSIYFAWVVLTKFIAFYRKKVKTT